MFHSWFIHSSLDGHLGCSHILVIVENTEMNMGCLCSFELVFWVLEVGSLGPKEGPFLIFWGIFILISSVAAPVCTPTYKAKGFLSLHILASMWMVDLRMRAILQVLSCSSSSGSITDAWNTVLSSSPAGPLLFFQISPFLWNLLCWDHVPFHTPLRYFKLFLS